MAINVQHAHKARCRSVKKAEKVLKMQTNVCRYDNQQVVGGEKHITAARVTKKDVDFYWWRSWLCNSSNRINKVCKSEENKAD